MNQESSPARKRLMLVVTKSNFGGAQRYVLDLATGLKDTYEVSVVTGVSEGSQKPGSLIPKLESEGIKTIYLPAMQRDVSALRDIRVFGSLFSAMRRERPDIVHLNSSKAGGLGALAARLVGVPRIVFTSHGLAYDEPRSRLSRTLIYIATWATFLLSHRIICISQDTAARARRMPLCKNKVSLVFNGFRAPAFVPREEARLRLASKTGPIPEKAVWIGAISELVPNKGLAYALHACNTLKRSGKEFVFLILGEGYLRPTLEDAIARMELEQHVRLLGFVPEAATLLKAFDISTLTSMKEGLPYVVMEAGHAQIPFAGTDIPGIRDIVDDGVSGTLSPTDDPERFADSISELIDEPHLRTRFAMRLNEKVVSEFSIEKMIENTKLAYATK